MKLRPILALALLARALPVAAQERVAAPFEQVRVTAEGHAGPIEATLLRVRGDTLVLSRSRRTPAIFLDLGQVRSVEVRERPVAPAAVALGALLGGAGRGRRRRGHRPGRPGRAEPPRVRRPLRGRGGLRRRAAHPRSLDPRHPAPGGAMIPPLLLLAAPSAGAPTAQEAPPVARRQKVRVWVPTAGIQGTTETVGRVTADGFDLRVRRPETVLPIPFALVERLKVGRGTRRRRGRPGGRHRGGVRRAGGPLEPRPSMRTRLLPPLLLLAGCEGVLDPEPSGDLGRALTGEEVGGMDEWWMPYLAWSPDGAEIFYRARESAEPRSEIRAVEVATGRTRVALATPSRRIESWALAGAGLYYSLDETIVSGPVLESPVLRVPAAGGAPTTVVDAASPWFAVSADERLVAYTSTREVPIGVGREYLYLRDVTAGTTRRLEYESAPIAFSPDRTELLAGDPFGLPTYRVYPVPGGAGRQVWGGASAGADLRGASWADGSLRLLSSRYAVQGDRAILTLAVRDPAGGTERTVATLRDLPAFTYWTSWSPSGRWIAAWVPGGCGFGLCARREWTLQMVDAGSGTARVLARGTFGFGSYPVFSPDERRVAYVLDGAVYLKELP